MSQQVFQCRPFKVRFVAIGLAVVFVVVFTLVAILLRSEWTGAYFQASDQYAMIGIGLVLAGAALLLVRPRVRADIECVEVRNVLGARRFSWGEVEHVSFPDGAAWARLELPDDEYVTILAIPAVDGTRSVAAIRELRRLKAQSAAETHQAG
ncbi:PH domain-containing protein [Actinocrispum wychmicini]|uniref:PH (Pleckstrin Homology) domain-containing protein n=1 Tax=Actinocrispum wychmicini TaxID=1213861 RepID=A0A4R2J0Z9_9PSEU|nr:PH domain-containing protein [Actinocrispum wychmicini]TCO48985.1 PH (Pleckstrin Homology) domain-containing protein [Actinocrispum wychmicini]